MTHSHTYRYRELSAIEEAAAPRLVLATSGGAEPHPYFFEGRALRPRLTADLLTAVHIVVRSRFFTPPSMLERILRLADPIVTSGGGLLRFEAFSSCCSTYVRVDLLPESYDGKIVGRGTTNVDFNAPMRAALARVRDESGLGISVGRDEVAMSTGEERVIERKVELPDRWLRSMVEVQSYFASMTRRFQVNGVEALRFLRSLPRASTARTPLWASTRATGLITSTRADPAAVRVSDASRLRVLEALAPRAEGLAIYSDDSQQSSAWVLSFPGARLTLALSAEVWRGFSGEGQTLRALLRMDAGTESLLPSMRAQLAWQSLLDPGALASKLGCATSALADGLRVLGASGLVGFDVTEGRYFHRVLPLDLSTLEDVHPRLRSARELLEEDAVTLDCASPLAARVRSDAAEHAVREEDGSLRCTCPWFAKHRGERGPCKHVLAVEVVRHRASAGA